MICSSPSAATSQGQQTSRDRPRHRRHLRGLAVREKAGLPITTADAQIAAIWLARGAACATRNTKDFKHTGVSLINPWEDAA
jgi:predicted nucleic acid-binding protein